MPQPAALVSTAAAAGGQRACPQRRFQKRSCRFGFGDYNEEEKCAKGKALHQDHAELQGSAEQPRIEGPRSSPTFIQKVRVVLEVAASNADTQLILQDSCEKLDRYLTEYCCKGSATTDDLIKVYAELAEAADENTSVQTLACKLLRRSVGMVDWPVQCVRPLADSNMFGLSPHHLSLPQRWRLVCRSVT